MDKATTVHFMCAVGTMNQRNPAQTLANMNPTLVLYSIAQMAHAKIEDMEIRWNK